MQATTNELVVYVGSENYPIKLTDSAVEAVQGEAAGKAQTALETLVQAWKTQDGGLDEWGIEELLTLRGDVQLLGEMIDVLVECRPLDELGIEDD